MNAISGQRCAVAELLQKYLRVLQIGCIEATGTMSLWRGSFFAKLKMGRPRAAFQVCLNLRISNFESPQPAQLTSESFAMTYDRKGCCQKRVSKCLMMSGEMCSMCIDISGCGKTTLCWIYGKASNIPCLRVVASDNTAELPAITGAVVLAPERDPAPVVVDGLAGEYLPERALVVRFKAGPANGAAMTGEWRQKPRIKVTSRMACNALTEVVQ